MADILIKGAPYRDWKPEKTLLGYQRRWVNDDSIYKICEKSRRVGFTWASAFADVSLVAPKGAKEDVWISSRDMVQARLYLRDCMFWAQKVDRAAQYLGKCALDDKHSMYSMAGRSGKNISAMSSNPDAQAGKDGHRRLDEFGLHKDPEALFDITYPGVIWGGTIWIWSTHRGSYHYFNRLVTEIREKGNPKGWSHHRVTIVDALENGLLVKLKAKLPENHPVQEMDEAGYYAFLEKGARDPEAFKQEFLCIPADDATAFLDYPLLQACFYPYNAPKHMDLDRLRDRGNPLYVGVDVGRDHDLTVIDVEEEIGGVLYERMRIEMKGKEFSEQEMELYAILGLPNCRRCCIDRNGLGRQFAERARKRFGDHKVEEVNFSTSSKADMAFPLRTRFEDRTLRIPDEPELIMDLRAIKKEYSAGSELPKFSADRGKNGHADRFWAKALAVRARGDGHVEFRFEPASAPGNVITPDMNEFWETAGDLVTLRAA